MPQWRFEFYSTKIAVTRDYYLCIFLNNQLAWETPQMTTDIRSANSYMYFDVTKYA